LTTSKFIHLVSRFSRIQKGGFISGRYISKSGRDVVCVEDVFEGLVDQVYLNDRKSA